MIGFWIKQSDLLDVLDIRNNKIKSDSVLRIDSHKFTKSTLSMYTIVF